MTRVQRSVLACLQDGWQLRGYWDINGSDYHTWELNKDGEPSRHVAHRTIVALVEQGKVMLIADGIWNRIGVLRDE